MKREISSAKRKKQIVSILLFIVLALGSFVFLFPFFWMISTSLKTDSEVWSYPIKWIPSKLIWKNYIEIFNILPFWRYFFNTFFITFCRITGQVISCSIVAYTFARIKFPGRNVLFILMLSTMMIPGVVTLIPSFVFFSKLNWVNTWLPLIVPMMFATPFNTFLLRQFYMALPKELDEAAKLDGCSIWGIFIRILLPLTKPAIAAIVVFEFMAGWNDFMGPLLYLVDDKLYTVSLALSFFQGKNHTDWQLLMAASTVASIPLLALFAIAQKYIIGGITMTGIKG